jgi:hypothetical protein
LRRAPRTPADDSAIFQIVPCERFDLFSRHEEEAVRAIHAAKHDRLVGRFAIVEIDRNLGSGEAEIDLSGKDQRADPIAPVGGD